MASDTAIQWADSTVNPTMGCDGCELWSLAKKPDNFTSLPQEQKDRRSCYAGILHDNRGGKVRGYAEDFKVPECFPGRIGVATKHSDLLGLRRLRKPWLNGLPRLVFVSDLSDALSKAIPFDYLAKEIIGSVTSPLGRRHHWL